MKRQALVLALLAFGAPVALSQGLDLTRGPILVCGDTAADLPMLRAALARRNATLRSR